MNNKNYLVLIRVISVVVPLLVAFLLFFPAKLNLGDWVYHIPAFNALLNTATSILLIAAIIAIKSKNIKWHQALMTSGFSLGAIFLLTYVLYHFNCNRLTCELSAHLFRRWNEVSKLNTFNCTIVFFDCREATKYC